jgi:hypothetical protein
VTKAFPILDTYMVPSGSMAIPSFYNSLHDPKVFLGVLTIDCMSHMYSTIIWVLSTVPVDI